jgi:hypothetical protein
MRIIGLYLSVFLLSIISFAQGDDPIANAVYYTQVAADLRAYKSGIEELQSEIKNLQSKSTSRAPLSPGERRLTLAKAELRALVSRALDAPIPFYRALHFDLPTELRALTLNARGQSWVPEYGLRLDVKGRSIFDDSALRDLAASLDSHAASAEDIVASKINSPEKISKYVKATLARLAPADARGTNGRVDDSTQGDPLKRAIYSTQIAADLRTFKSGLERLRSEIEGLENKAAGKAALSPEVLRLTLAKAELYDLVSRALDAPTSFYRALRFDLPTELQALALNAEGKSWVPEPGLSVDVKDRSIFDKSALRDLAASLNSHAEEAEEIVGKNLKPKDLRKYLSSAPIHLPLSVSEVNRSAVGRCNDLNFLVF